ncbi:anoctamin-7-like isoform X1 [Tachypleus tridentatus]|uniref:anoctamin-7-like isoform X1 n=1 Tax=Tachypleus tridentatus TaxID=6853 RepID=UPI003FD0F02D
MGSSPWWVMLTAVIFMELWKRYSAKITHHWDVTNFDTLEEHPRPEYLAKLSKVKKKKVNFITGVNEPCVSFWKRRVPCTIFSWSVVLLLGRRVMIPYHLTMYLPYFILHVLP